MIVAPYESTLDAIFDEIRKWIAKLEHTDGICEGIVQESATD